MKVLHLSGSKNHWSGNEQQLADLINNLNNLEVKSSIFCYENSEISKYARKNNISYFPQRIRSIYSPKLAKSLKRVIAEQNIDVIHIHTSNFLTVFMVADLLFKLKTHTIFSRKGFSEKSSFLSALKYNYKNINYTICISDAVREGMKNFIYKKNHKKLVVIYDGISTKKEKANFNIRNEYNIDNNNFIVGNIANHVPAKDLFTFIKTVNYLVKDLSLKNVHFIQIGKKTALTQELEQLILDLNLNKYITFTDTINNAKNLISQFDIFLMPSKSEGGPLTIYESFLHEVPVVSTKVGVAEEAIIDSENGFLCDVGDYKCLAKGIQNLVTSKTLRSNFTQKSKLILEEKFDSKICAKQTLNLYNKIVSN